jgi:hypothetical protein
MPILLLVGTFGKKIEFSLELARVARSGWNAICGFRKKNA